MKMKFVSLVRQLSGNLVNNQNRSNVSSRITQQFEPMPSNVESNQDEQTTSINASNANEMAIANDATQLLLTRLGILRRKYFARRVSSINGKTCKPEESYIVERGELNPI
jgi:hypothetical protein